MFSALKHSLSGELGHKDPSEVSKDHVGSSEKKVCPRTVLSAPTLSYTVQPNDTLMSIAARFDTTPSELTKMNRLATRYLFSGQLLVVPDKGGSKENITTETDSIQTPSDLNVNSSFGENVQGIPIIGGKFPRTPVNSIDTERSLDRDCLEKFLKIKVRHVTDGQGVVSGVLLVTPNAVMFDPYVSDPLVIERGSESYGVIAPMDFVLNAALFFDIAHMKVRDTEIPRMDMPKPEIYYGPAPVNTEEHGDLQVPLHVGEGELNQESPSRDVSIGKHSNFGELAGGSSQENDNDSSCSCGGETRDSSAFPKAFEHEILTPASSETSPTELVHAPVSHQSSSGVGELPPIAEASRPEELIASLPTREQLASVAPVQECLQMQAVSSVTSNDKKRTTSITFSTSSDSEMAPVPEDCTEPPSQESRKQKVMKRLSYPLSWMEGFAPDKDAHSLGHQNICSSAPPTGAGPGPCSTDDSKQAGMFSNVFNMSNVSNMLTSSPKYLADFSSGLFRSDTSGSGSLRDIPDLIPQAVPRTNTHINPSSPSIFPSTFSSSSPSLIPSNLNKRLPSHLEKGTDFGSNTTGRPSLDFVRRSQPNEQVISSSQPAQKRAQFKEGPKFGLKSMVSIEDMPDLFASLDKRWKTAANAVEQQTQLIPKPTSTCEDPPLYLCLRMGKPLDKPIPKATPIMTYGKKTMRPEYWFSIPKNRVDELYNFFQVWASDIYGEVDEKDIHAKGFVLIDEEIKVWSQGDGDIYGDNSDTATELKEMTKESWEILKAPYVKLYSLMKIQMTISTEGEIQESSSMSEELRRALYSSNSLTSLDLELFLPEITGTSEIVDDAFRKNMYRTLPARVQGYNWGLVFSSSQHGFSLKSLYRKMADIETPVLLCIQDTSQCKFGAFLSCPLRVSEMFYGTGESFLFICQPSFQSFPWTGDNTFFVKGNNESLYIGGGDGNFGIWLDGDLYQGRTQTCKTFGNPPLCQTEDFIIKTIECWYFE